MEKKPNTKLLTVIFLSVQALVWPAFAARTIYVDQSGGGDFDNIQEAVDDSNDGDVVVVADGTYSGPGNYDIDFKGKSITVKSQNGPEVTIVDAQDQGCCFWFGTAPAGDHVLEGFTVTGSDERCGRGINCGSASPKIINCIVSGNKRDGIRCGGRSEIIDCIISNNGRRGIYCAGGGVIISNCTIANNEDAGIRCSVGSPTITNCTVIGNMCGIECSESSAKIENCLIASNHSQLRGGGIQVSRGSPTVSNCTIVGNSSELNGGGINFYESHYMVQLTVRNCILWSNSDSNGVTESSQIYRHDNGGTVLVKHSCIQGWSGYWGGTGNTGADPCFIDPDNSDPNNRDFRFLADSPCIDAGMDTWPDPMPATDLDGSFRQIDGNNDGVVVVDMGAYEYGTVDTPLIYAKPDHSEFVYRVDGPDPDPQILYVRNIGSDTLNWQISEDCLWLETEPTSGSSAGEVNEVTLSVDTGGLPPGRYVCELTISDQAAANGPVTVSVALAVYAEGRLHVPGQFLTIQAAINAANPGDTVIVADGTYTGNGNRDIDFSKSITVKSENGPEHCIIDCQGTPVQRHRGFYLRGDPNSILDGFTITNGHHNHGGAIHCAYFGTRPSIANCIIKGNYAEDEGGGIYIADYSCAMLTNCTFSDNAAGNYGGAMVTEGRVIAIDCTFLRNSAGERGGGVYDLYGYRTLINCTLSGNSAFRGGALYTHESDTRLTNCTLTGNTADRAGGIYFDDDTELTCKNCILWDNSDSSGAGEAAQIWATDTVYINQSCIQGWTGEFSEFVGTGNIGDDPCFAEAGYWADANDPNTIVEPNDPNASRIEGDYHLKSQAGRWNVDEGRWTIDDVTSPCIDAGDPMIPIGYEPFPNGGIVNMGAYGGTAEASKSYFGEPICETIVAGDMNGDCAVNFPDFGLMALHWMIDYEQFDCPECPLIED